MLRFGIVGAGGIAKKFINDLSLIKNAKLSAIAARSPEKATAYKKTYHPDYVFSSYEDMANSDCIDAVYIATPHNFHYEQALLFIRAHKHVLIEKPITVNEKQLDHLIEEAKKHQVLMMEAMWTYFLPATQWLRVVLEHQLLGKLQKAVVSFGFPLTIGKKPDHRLLDPNLAGGGLLDMGVYPINYYLLLSKSSIKSLSVKAQFTKTSVDGFGIIGIIDEDQTEYILKYSINKLLGDKAVLKFEHGEIIMKDFHGCQEVKLNGHSIPLKYEGLGFTHQIRSFVDSVLNHQLENKIVSLKHSKQSMALLDRIRQEMPLTYPFE